MSSVSMVMIYFTFFGTKSLNCVCACRTYSTPQFRLEFQIFSSHMGLVATILDRADLDLFFHL